MSSHEEPGEYASSPCYEHEFADPAVRISPQIAADLNQLLEGERAGAKGLLDMKQGVDEELRAVLDAVARDEARFCAMLRRHLERHGHSASPAVGVFYEKLEAREDLQAKLRLLDRGQSAVVRALDALLPSIADPGMREDLEEMRDTHVRNIEICARYLQD